MNILPNVDSSWLGVLKTEFGKPYFGDLKNFLIKETNAGKIIYPPTHQIFAAFSNCPFDKVKVVILGQDPYHGPDQAHGLAFSVNKAVRVPPSLKNIYKALQNDLECTIPDHGDLSAWAEQGVLLLNTTLTVEHKMPTAHSGQGWEIFTDHVIQTISAQKEHVVFLLWGNFARAKKSLIDTHKHLVLEAPHPSPLSAHTGFFDSQHFSKTNQYLIDHQQVPIDWQI